MFASSMIRVFPSLEHSAGHVRKSWDNLRTFVWRFCRCWIKHNRAKPMSELPSALFSIADGSEFRFARFYSVCEAAALAATRKFAHCLWFGGHTPGVFKRGRDTESDANIQPEEMLTFFSNEFPSAFHQKSKDMVFFAYYFSHQKGTVWYKWAAPSFLRFFMTDAKRSHIFSDRS